MRKRKNQLNSELLKYISLITQLGLTVISSILILLVVSIYLEKKLQTNGIIILIGILIGTVVGVFSAYKLLKKSIEKDNKKYGR